MKKDLHVLINASASSGHAAAVWEQVKKCLEDEKIPYKPHFPGSREETIRLVRELTDLMPGSPDCHLLVLGGDGTLNAVVNGIICFEKTKLSVIPTGSGNDFAANMDLEKDPSSAVLNLIRNPREDVIDYGELRVRKDAGEQAVCSRFVISSGMGYDADICENVSRSRLKKILNRIHLGKLVYVMIGIKRIFMRKSPRAILRMDGREPVKIKGLFFCVGMIHPMEGGGVPFCPEADCRDGQLDLCIVRQMPKIKLMAAVALVYLKKHTLLEKVSTDRCRKLTITSEQPQWFHMDGETPFMARYLHMECRKGLHIIR